ncbi:glycosyltransferase [Pyrococcus kukulkanii]|uniref:glycosyltransferase n=1 Tax=Pyrococcus kukulkanii TaxID=1609559 RepID=UPI003561F346
MRWLKIVSVVHIPYNVRLLIDNIEKFSRFKVTHVDINLPTILEKYYYLTVHIGLGSRDFVLPTYLAKKLNSKCDNSDIIHTHIKNYVMRYAVRRRKSNKNKIVATVHNLIPEFITYLVSYDFHRNFNVKQIREKIELLKHYDMVVTVSKFIADMLRELYNVENAIHIPNPIDPVKDVQEKVLEFDLQKYGLELKGYVVWLPNRLLTYKNPLLFLRLAKEFPDETFVMASNQITWEGLVSYLKRHGIGENPPENLKVITLPSKNSRGYFLHILQNAKFSIITLYYIL